MKFISTVVLALALAACTGLPKLSITPVSLDSTIGGEHETQVDEDNMIKVQTGDSSNVRYVTDTVEQVYNEVQEYPLWLVLAFALALPTPFGIFRGWRRNRRYEKQIDRLNKQLEVRLDGELRRLEEESQ